MLPDTAALSLDTLFEVFQTAAIPNVKRREPLLTRRREDAGASRAA